MSRRNHSALDVAKFACALMILCAHVASTWGPFPVLLDCGFSIYVIAVPFFFACSGFLLFRKLGQLGEDEKKGALWKYVRHIAVMYLAWSLVYFAFVLIGWIQEEAPASVVLAYFHRAVVFTTYATIWFLPALLIGILVVHFLNRRLSLRAVFFIGLVFYLLGTLGYSYSFMISRSSPLGNMYRLYSDVFLTTRNGVFNGFPFVALGAWMSCRKKRMSREWSGLLTCLSLVVLVAETFALRLGAKVNGVDTAISLLPFTFFFMEFLLSLELKDRRIYRQLREMSTMLFLGQRLYISALPSVLPAAAVTTVFRNPYLALGLILGLTGAQSWICIRMSEKHAFLKVFR